MTRPIVVVAGPTASGKSALAVDLAERFDGCPINADSMQLYRELAVLTAQPDAAARARAPHRLYGVVAMADGCSVGRWRGMAAREIETCHRAGRLPIVVGGTGLYLHALTRGLAHIPPTPRAVRARVRERLRTAGAGAVHAELARRDPEMAARLAPRDGQRAARALEVLESTGRSLAAWQRRPVDAPPWPVATLLLSPPRDALYAACDARFDRMMEAGALDEAESVAALGLPSDLPAMKAVGLPPLLRHLAGEIPLDEARRLGKRDTRRYAKRQLTWQRHRLTPTRTCGEQHSERLNAKIFPIISDFLLTHRV